MIKIYIEYRNFPIETIVRCFNALKLALLALFKVEGSDSNDIKFGKLSLPIKFSASPLDFSKLIYKLFLNARLLN
jgi:hypothetical protein